MRITNRIVGITAATIALCALSAPANAIAIEFDEIVTGAIPFSGTSPWLTATVTNAAGGVQITLSTSVVNPEFITSVFFNLAGGVYDGDSTGYGCGTGANPANTGPYDLCLGFAPSLHWDGPAATFFVSGLTESDFLAYNDAGYRAVAHVQGIQPDCSGWIGDYGTGSVSPSGGYTCGTSVPEPGTLGLLGLGLFGMAAGMRRRRKH